MVSVALAAMLSMPATTFAQQREGESGLFRNDPNRKSSFFGGVFNHNDVRSTELGGDYITNGYFGEEPDAPLGSGIAVLLGLGLGYVALKKKEGEQ